MTSTKMKLYEFAVIYIPTEETLKSAIIVAPRTALAESQDKAMIIASRAIPDDYMDKLDDLQVVVRPF